MIVISFPLLHIPVYSQFCINCTVVGSVGALGLNTSQCYRARVTETSRPAAWCTLSSSIFQLYCFQHAVSLIPPFLETVALDSRGNADL
jgi:hypothetical protein